MTVYILTNLKLIIHIKQLNNYYILGEEIMYHIFSLKYASAKLWNNLSETVKIQQCKGQFKTKLKCLLI